MSLKQVEKYLDNKKKITPKINSNKIWQYFELDKKIKKINIRLQENKKIEMQRIFDKYLKKESSHKNNSEKEKVVSSLIGEDNVQSELRKQKDNNMLAHDVKNQVELIGIRSAFYRVSKKKLYFDYEKKLGIKNNQ